MSVYGLLASGTDEELMAFHLKVCMLLNGIDRRDRTVRYTCMSEDMDTAIAVAQTAGVTLERIDRSELGEETYTMLVRNKHEGWAAYVASKQ